MLCVLVPDASSPCTTHCLDGLGRQTLVAKFLARHGDGFDTAVLRVDDATTAEYAAAATGFRSIELGVQRIPMTVPATDLP